MTEAAPYEFMFKSDGTPKLPEILDFRRAVASMPENKAMFRPTSHLERGTVMHFRWEPKLLYFVGSWEVPEWFSSGSGIKSHFANPDFQGRERYAISGSRCACGNVITDINPTKPVEEIHAEGCTPADRAAVNQRVKDIRLQRVVVGAHLNQILDDIAPSLGVTKAALSYFVEESGLDWAKLRDVGRHRMAKTIDILHDHGYSYREIAEVFGCSKTMVQDYSSRKVFNRRLESVA